jgi:hypothetical protein
MIPNIGEYYIYQSEVVIVQDRDLLKQIAKVGIVGEDNLVFPWYWVDFKSLKEIDNAKI